MRHGTFLIPLHVFLHIMPHALGETSLSEVCVDGECGAPKQSRSLIQKRKSDFRRKRITEDDLGNGGVQDEEVLPLRTIAEDSAVADEKENSGADIMEGEDNDPGKNKGADLVEEHVSIHQQERTDFQKLRITKDNSTFPHWPHVWLGPNDFHEHRSVCTEEKNGYYCDKYSANPENRINDRDENHWTYWKGYFDVYRSTAICAKRIDGTKTWDQHLKIACRARELGNWDKKAYWDKLNPNVHRWHPNWYPDSPYVTKELFIGPNKYGKEAICIEEREGWECDETSGNVENRLNDRDEPGWKDEFKIYRSNPICAKLDHKLHPGINRWTIKMDILCGEGLKGCEDTKLRDKEQDWTFLKYWDKNNCVRRGDCISSKNYPQNYSTHDECSFKVYRDATVCRLGNFGILPGGPYFKIKPYSERHGDGDYHNIDSPIAMPPELKKYDEFEWLVRGSTPSKGWHFCFKPK